MNQGRIIVITGAPGTGKTTTASAVAKESDLEKSVHMHTDDFYHYLSTVLLRPSMLSLLSVPRVWDTSQQAIFNRRAAAQEGENTEVGTRFLCLL